MIKQTYNQLEKENRELKKRIKELEEGKRVKEIEDKEIDEALTELEKSPILHMFKDKSQQTANILINDKKL